MTLSFLPRVSPDALVKSRYVIQYLDEKHFNTYCEKLASAKNDAEKKVVNLPLEALVTITSDSEHAALVAARQCVANALFNDLDIIEQVYINPELPADHDNAWINLRNGNFQAGDRRFSWEPHH